MQKSDIELGTTAATPHHQRRQQGARLPPAPKVGNKHAAITDIYEGTFPVLTLGYHLL